MLVSDRMHAVSHVARDKLLHSGRAHEDFCYGQFSFLLGEYIWEYVYFVPEEEGVPTVTLADLCFSPLVARTLLHIGLKLWHPKN